MSTPFSDHLGPLREAAAQTAASVLMEGGFERRCERRWRGPTPRGNVVEVELPPGFPDVLPRVFVSDHANGHVAHLDHQRKLCLAPESGMLIDTARPGAVVRDALARADIILAAEPSQQEADIRREYLAYWSEHVGPIVSICPPRSGSGPVWSIEMREPAPMTLISSDSAAGWDWCNATGRKVASQTEAYLVRLDRLPSPPAFGAAFTLRHLVRFLEDAADADRVRAFRGWLSGHGLPATVLLSAPVGDGTDALFAAIVPNLGTKAAAEAERGFRKDHVPAGVLVARAQGETVLRAGVDRADTAYLLPRGGASASLATRTVAVVGCGSLGSHTAGALAASGVGHLVLIDAQVLAPENIYRHLLGAAHLGVSKVKALAEVLRARFPALRVTPIASKVEDALDQAESPLATADLILCATGEENLGLRLNEYLRGSRRCVHAWIDPLGIGGHVLRTGTAGHAGCYRCLFRLDPSSGPMNMASLVAPNQHFQRSMAGCAGTFTPFGALDAERAGIEAAREVIACLTSDVPAPLLTSWVVSKAGILDAGFKLSRRGETIPEGCTHRETSVAAPDCPVCAGGAA